jgi:hypothetical protein
MATPLSRNPRWPGNAGWAGTSLCPPAGRETCRPTFGCGLSRNDAVKCRAAPWCAPQTPSETRCVFRGMDQGPALHRLVLLSSFVRPAPIEWIRPVPRGELCGA